MPARTALGMPACAGMTGCFGGLAGQTASVYLVPRLMLSLLMA